MTDFAKILTECYEAADAAVIEEIRFGPKSHIPHISA